LSTVKIVLHREAVTVQTKHAIIVANISERAGGQPNAQDVHHVADENAVGNHASNLVLEQPNDQVNQNHRLSNCRNKKQPAPSLVAGVFGDIIEGAWVVVEQLSHHCVGAPVQVLCNQLKTSEPLTED
jgi:hypothetical protein